MYILGASLRLLRRGIGMASKVEEWLELDLFVYYMPPLVFV